MCSCLFSVTDLSVFSVTLAVGWHFAHVDSWQLYFTEMPEMVVYVRSYGGWMLSVTSRLHAHVLTKELERVRAAYNHSYHYGVGYDRCGTHPSLLFLFLGTSSQKTVYQSKLVVLYVWKHDYWNNQLIFCSQFLSVVSKASTALWEREKNDIKVCSFSVQTLKMRF